MRKLGSASTAVALGAAMVLGACGGGGAGGTAPSTAASGSSSTSGPNGALPQGDEPYAPGVGPLLSLHTDGVRSRSALVSYTPGR